MSSPISDSVSMSIMSYCHGVYAENDLIMDILQGDGFCDPVVDACLETGADPLLWWMAQCATDDQRLAFCLAHRARQKLDPVRENHGLIDSSIPFCTRVSRQMRVIVKTDATINYNLFAYPAAVRSDAVHPDETRKVRYDTAQLFAQLVPNHPISGAVPDARLAAVMTWPVEDRSLELVYGLGAMLSFLVTDILDGGLDPADVRRIINASDDKVAVDRALMKEYDWKCVENTMRGRDVYLTNTIGSGG